MTATVKKEASRKRVPDPNNTGKRIYIAGGMFSASGQLRFWFCKDSVDAMNCLPKVVTTGSRERVVKPATNWLPVFLLLGVKVW
jgi:hypothetical protein